jgi:hypothetical protein
MHWSRQNLSDQDINKFDGISSKEVGARYATFEALACISLSVYHHVTSHFACSNHLSVITKLPEVKIIYTFLPMYQIKREC